MKPMIQLLDGRGFHFHQPRVPDIEVIAASSAKLCRFVGHTNEFYSVAQHAVHVSEIVEPKYALGALLHDGSESVTGDMNSPLKAILREFHPFERNYQYHINMRYCPEIEIDQAYQKAVKTADLVMLATERRDFMPKEDPDGVWKWVEKTVQPLPDQLLPWSWKVARDTFLWRFHQILNGDA